jgi:CDP-diglyceride synthetase
LFDNWKTAPRALLVSFLVIGIAVWSWEVFVYRSVWQFADIYRTVYSFFIVLLAVWQANKMFVQEKRALTKNATFLICIGFVFYYTIKCTVELLYQLNITFATYIWGLLSYSNNILVCIYILAVLRMPEKKAFSLQATTQ